MLEFAPQLLQKLGQTVLTRWSNSASIKEVFPIPPRMDIPPLHVVLKDTHATLDPSLATALEFAQQHLALLQQPSGFWEGSVHDNVTITAEYLMTLRFLGLLDQTTAQKAKETILQAQLENGAWNIYRGGPPEHSATVEAYFALKLCGMTSRHKPLERARQKILEQGGIATTRVFTKIHLALFGQYSWDQIPVINPELMLLPKKAPIHIYEFSSWSRAVIIPLLIIFDRKPIHPLPKHQGVSELHLPVSRVRKRDQLKKIIQNRKVDLEQIFHVAQTVLSIYEKIPLKPLRKKALDRAEKWILEHQDPDGNWGGIFPAMANSIVALHLRGYTLDHPILKNGLKVLRSFAQETKTMLRMQSTVSPVWDTGIAAYTLSEAGRRPTDSVLRKSADWLIKLQILNVEGDWKHKARPSRPGGWPFEFENDQYPDIDDSALAILALLPHEHASKPNLKVTHSIDRGIEWLLGMQGSDGGWGAFDRDNNRHILNQIPFADLKSLLDPSTPDVTGHVIEALGAAGYERHSEPIEKAIGFLKKSQEPDGSWYGRWGVAYIYGTGAVLSGLKVARENMKTAYIEKSHTWLSKIQNSDGGWGESCAAYDKGRYVPLGYSTASQTAWALIGLLACPQSSEKSIQKGVRYLLDHQKPDGSWDEPEWTGTGFPRHFYLRYDYYRIYFPLLALARYVRKLHGNQSKTVSASA